MQKKCKKWKKRIKLYTEDCVDCYICTQKSLIILQEQKSFKVLLA